MALARVCFVRSVKGWVDSVGGTVETSLGVVEGEERTFWQVVIKF